MEVEVGAEVGVRSLPPPLLPGSTTSKDSALCPKLRALHNCPHHHYKPHAKVTHDRADTRLGECPNVLELFLIRFFSFCSSLLLSPPLAPPLASVASLSQWTS